MDCNRVFDWVNRVAGSHRFFSFSIFFYPVQFQPQDRAESDFKTMVVDNN